MTTREKIDALKKFLVVLPPNIESYKDRHRALEGCMTHLRLQDFFASDEEEQEYQLEWWEKQFKMRSYIRDSFRMAERKNFT